LKKLAVNLLLCLTLATSVVGVVAATPAHASHGGEVDCWTVEYFAYNEWLYDNYSIYPYNYSGWWRNIIVDRYEECANGAWYYLGRGSQYPPGWHRCYCQPYWYDQGNDVYY
jgi:hypothetical protein